MSTTPISRITGRPLAAAPPPKPDLPAYPHHYAASSIGSQVAHKRDQWGATARALREEVAAAEEARHSAHRSEPVAGGGLPAVPGEPVARALVA